MQPQCYYIYFSRTATTSITSTALIVIIILALVGALVVIIMCIRNKKKNDGRRLLLLSDHAPFPLSIPLTDRDCIDPPDTRMLMDQADFGSVQDMADMLSAFCAQKQTRA